MQEVISSIRCLIVFPLLQPLISLCGNNASAPDFKAAVARASPWTFEEQSLQRILDKNSANTANTADLRSSPWPVHC